MRIRVLGSLAIAGLVFAGCAPSFEDDPLYDGPTLGHHPGNTIVMFEDDGRFDGVTGIYTADALREQAPRLFCSEDERLERFTIEERPDSWLDFSGECVSLGPGDARMVPAWHEPQPVD